MNNISFNPGGTVYGDQINTQNNYQVNNDKISDERNEVLSLLLEMTKLASSINDNHIKNDVVDDLNIIKKEIESSTYDTTIIEKATRCIKRALEPIKGVTTVSTLLVHLNTLWPLVAALLQPAVG